MKQVYLDLVDGFHIKVKPLKWVPADCPANYPSVLLQVEETACGFTKGEEIVRHHRYLFCIAGYSNGSGKIKAVVPDLGFLQGDLE